MKAAKQTNDQVSTDLPRVPVAQLVGHDGPVQAVKFTGAFKEDEITVLSCIFFGELHPR